MENLKNIYVRWDEHKKELNKGIHNNKHLQRSWNKYGEDAFVFEILERCDNNDKAYQREKYWIDYYDSFENGYNMNEGGTGGLGYKHTEEDRKRMSEIKKEQMKNSSARQLLSEKHKILKPIIQVDLVTRNKKLWNDCYEIENTIGFSRKNILKCANKKNIYSNGSLWFFADDYSDDFDILSYIRNTDAYYIYTRFYQYKFNGELIKIWNYNELCNSDYKNRNVYNACKNLTSFDDSLWLFEEDINSLYILMEKYKHNSDLLCEPINIYTIDECLIKECTNVHNARDEYKINSNSILQCCYGIRRSAYGYIFKFKNKEYLYNNGKIDGDKKREKQINHIKKKIVQYDLEMNVIKIWDSVTDIHNKLGYDRGTIINNCKGRTETSHGFIWRYYEEEHSLQCSSILL